MISSPIEKETPPPYSESEALVASEPQAFVASESQAFVSPESQPLVGSGSRAFVDSADVHPANVDENEYELQDLRPLPLGWIRQWDSRTKTYFYVDTTANPPRSTWDHPEDLIEEHQDAPDTAWSRPFPEEKVETKVDWEDVPRSSPPSLYDRSDFVLPTRRGKRSGPLGFLVRLLFNHRPGSTAGDSSISRAYAPPPRPRVPRVSRCGQRRAEMMARRLERREQLRAWSDAKWAVERPNYGSGFKRGGCCARSWC
ncbi:hypothetical protein FRC01_008097 [Tulasnella sp. 417]|nr:hypothetical protein FRC01_008097 [Tulasnella sp. 417]